MKKPLKILIYIFLIFLTILFGFFIYKVFAKQDKKQNDSIESCASEISYFEDKFVSLFNQLNNISFDNYKISASKIEETNNISDSSNNSSSSNNNSSSNSSGSSKNSNDVNNTNSSSNDKNSNKTTENSSSGANSTNYKENKQQFKMQGTGILTGDKSINWEQIQNDVEIMYTKLSSLTLNLYQKQVNQDDILNFNKEFDNLTVSVKSTDKEKTLDSLAKLYGYLPEFVNLCSNDEKNKIIISTKNDILQAYSLLDKDDWKKMQDYINSASQEFGRLLTDVNSIENENKYNTNKIYIMINELSNSINLQDKEVFLIKYKNLMEELQNFR